MKYKYLVVVVGDEEKATTLYDTVTATLDADIECSMFNAIEFDNQTILVFSTSLLEEKELHKVFALYENNLYLANIVTYDDLTQINGYTPYALPEDNSEVEEAIQEEQEIEALESKPNNQYDYFIENIFDIKLPILELKADVEKVSDSPIYSGLLASYQEIERDYDALGNQTREVNFERAKDKLANSVAYQNYKMLIGKMKAFKENSADSLKRIELRDLPAEQKAIMLEDRKTSNIKLAKEHRQQLVEKKQEVILAVENILSEQDQYLYDLFKLSQNMKELEKVIYKTLQSPVYQEVKPNRLTTKPSEAKESEQDVQTPILERVIPTDNTVPKVVAVEASSSKESIPDSVSHETPLDAVKDMVADEMSEYDDVVEPEEVVEEESENTPTLEELEEKSSIVAILAKEKKTVSEPKITLPAIPEEEASEDDDIEPEEEDAVENEEIDKQESTIEDVDQPIMPIRRRRPTIDKVQAKEVAKEQVESEPQYEETTLESGSEVEEKELASEPKQKNTNSLMKNKVAIGCLGFILLLTLLSAGALMASHSMNKPKEDKIVKTTKSSTSKKKYALTDKEYKANVKIMANANQGMFLDDAGTLKGAIKVKNQQGKEQVRTIKSYTKDGELETLDENGALVVYPKKWVDAYVTLLEKTTVKKD